MTYYPNVPVRDPRAGTSGERTARILCIVITVLAVVVSFPILVTTQTSVSHDSAAAPPPAGPDRAQLLATFPVPPATVSVSVTSERRAYRASSTLAAVKAFYMQRLAREHVEWEVLDPDTAYVGSTSVVTGWHGPVFGEGQPPSGLDLTLTDGNVANTAPGTVTIVVGPE